MKIAKPTIYYECGITARLTPVKFIGWAKTPAHHITGGFNAVVKTKRATPEYELGTIFHVPSRAIVNKAGRRDYFQLVRKAVLPEIDTKNLIPARV